MNINYHYFVIKTLALTAQFAEESAQKIAYYSQMIDDFDVTPIFGYTITVDKKPPAFFFENHLAGQRSSGDYWFYPVTTAISLSQAIFKNARKYTYLPYHFIPKNQISASKPLMDRRLYRCVRAADCDENAIINKIKHGFYHKKIDLMELGMFLHTYADTYAHHGFSGLHGEENFAYIDTTTSKMNILSKLFYFRLFSAGHANVAHLPDAGNENFTYSRIPAGESEYTEHVRRDNIEEYEICSRSIFDFLCQLNGKQTWGDQLWKPFYERIKQINCEIFADDNENTDVQQLATIWTKKFEVEGYTYGYDKNSGFLNIRVEQVNTIDYEGLKSEGLKESDIYEVFSEKGRTAQRFANVRYTVNDDFFKYNQAAYIHLKKVYGELPIDLKADAELTDGIQNTEGELEHGSFL